MKRPLTHWFLVALCALAVGGPGQSAQAAGKKLKLAFVTNNASDFWTIARAGTTKAAQDLQNVTVQFRIPEDGTAATQTRILDDLLSAGVDGIAISPVDPKNETIKLDEVGKQCLLLLTTVMRRTATGSATSARTTSPRAVRQAI